MGGSLSISDTSIEVKWENQDIQEYIMFSDIQIGWFIINLIEHFSKDADDVLKMNILIDHCSIYDYCLTKKCRKIKLFQLITIVPFDNYQFKSQCNRKILNYIDGINNSNK